MEAAQSSSLTSLLGASTHKLGSLAPFELYLNILIMDSSDFGKNLILLSSDLISLNVCFSLS